MRPVHFVLFLLFILLADSLYGQRRSKRFDTFSGGVVAGMNISQMDGDYFTGFDKAGLYAGLRGNARFSSRLSLNIDLLFSQKGSKIPHGTYVTDNEIRDRTIGLNYVEVPIMLKINLKPVVNSPFLEFGGSFSQLISTRIKEKEPGTFRGTAFKEIAQDFRSFDYNVIAGLGFNAGEHLQFALRYSFGVNKFYINEAFVPRVAFSPLPKEVEFLRNYYISLLAAYTL
jgi:hypothetical protein